MNKKHSSPAQKKISQQVVFQRRINASKNIEQASNVCFSVLAKSMRKDSFTEFLYMFRNFLDLPVAKNIMNYRYKGDTIDIFNIKTMPFEMLEIRDVVKWLTEIFGYFSEDLNDFVKAKVAITNNILLADFEGAKRNLEKFIDDHGVCNWTIATELSLLYFQGKITEYKDKIKEFTHIEDGLSQSFLTYEGIRCNPSVTSERYRFSIGKMIEEVRIDNQPQLEETIKYRHDFSPCDVYSNMDFIFSNTCEKRIFDMYNSFKRFIFYKYNDGSDISEIVTCVEKLTNSIHDSEIEIFYKRISGTESDIKDEQYNEVIDNYINNNYERVITQSEKILLEKPYFSVIYLPYIKSLVRKKQNTSLPGPIGEIIRLSCNLFSNIEFEDSLKKLSKIYYVLLHNDWVHIIGCILDNFDGSDGINNPKRYNYVDSLLLINNKLSFRDSTNFKWLDDENISAWRRDKIKADKYFYDGEYGKALNLYSNSLDKSEKNYIEELKAKIIYCHFSLGEISVAITILSEQLSKGANPRTLPINTVAEYVAKEGHYKTNNDELYNEAIILNAYNKNIIAKYIQHTSNVCENFLENIDVTDKNQITFENESIPAFFLTELLSIDVLEGMTSIIESEVDVLLTRLNIDRYIVTNEEKFDSKTVRKSKNEITNIFYKLIVQACSNEAGEGRIYVDKSSLKAKLINDVERELEILRGSDNKELNTYVELTDDHGIEYHTMSTPFMRDVFDLMMKVSDGYTIDKLYGIDQSLNVGIRHGGIVNLLWAPLKNNGIAALKSKDSKFIPNPVWRNDFGYYNKGFLDSIDKNLVLLNEKLNTIINDAKEKVHINTGEFIESAKVFNYAIEIEFVEEMAGSIDKIDGDTFIELIFNYLDEKTNDCLDYAKNNFIPKLRHEMIDAIQNTRNEIKIENINRAISQSKIQLEESIEFLQSWFNWSGTSKTPFALKAAIEKSRLILSKLHPWLEINFSGSLNTQKIFLGKHFTPIVTLLTLIFENVVKHGANRDSTEIIVDINENNDVIELSFVNKVQEPFNQDELEKFSRINEILDTEYETYSARETGSGIFKIKKILSLELKCKNHVHIHPTENSFGITIGIYDNGGMFE